MKNWMIIVLCICLAVSFTACSQRGDTKGPATAQSQSVNESPSIASEPESKNELPVSSNDDEALDEELQMMTKP